MEGQNHSLKKGNINKLPLFLVLGFCLISLISVFILTMPKKIKILLFQPFLMIWNIKLKRLAKTVLI